MPFSFRNAAALAAVLALSSAASLPASAQEGVKLGSLTCISEGSTGFILGSSENVTCTFDPADSSQPNDLYAGKLDTFGLDVGITGETVMEWVVLAASNDVYRPGALGGRYVGATANISFAVGAGANVLVGGTQDAFALQPLSLQAQEGVNAAIGVSEFTLTPVASIVK